MHLVQILLPLRDLEGRAFDEAMYAQVRGELAEHFGGITAFTRAPEGFGEAVGRADRDDLLVFEVMSPALDQSWWEGYRAELERRFRQEAIAIRAIRVEML